MTDYGKAPLIRRFVDVTYCSEPLPLKCPDEQTECPLDDLTAYIADRIGTDGCCVRSRGFCEFECEANGAASPCVAYRRWCPHTACAEGQVVDRATMVCIDAVK